MPGDYPATESRKIKATRRVVDLYAAWHAAEPGKGYDAKADEWRASIDVEDVMQVTCTEAFSALDQLSGRTAEAFEAWLTRMAHNDLRDAIKKLERHKRPDPRRRVPGVQ